jgi:molecular chaperone DnaK (HSP70)
MKRILAIDFGTTTTSFAETTVDDSYPPRVIEIDGSPSVESVVRFNQDGEIELWGSKAWDRIDEAPKRTVYEFKLGIGDPQKIPLGNISLSSKEISIAFLKILREKIEEQTWNGGKIDGIIGMTVVGFPAEWTEIQQKETIEVVQQAGFPCVVKCQEPVAAVYWYRYSQSLPKQLDHPVLVYDFGGGTIDSCVVSPDGDDHLKVIAWSGLHGKGGKYFDDLLSQYFAERLIQETGIKELSEPDKTRIRRASRQIKEKLADHPNDASLSCWLDATNGTYQFSLDQQKFEDICRTLIAKSKEPLKDVLNQAGTDDIGYTVLAGGSSRFYFVPSLLGELLPGKPVPLDEEAQLIVAKGLALYGRTKSTGEVFQKPKATIPHLQNNSEPAGSPHKKSFPKNLIWLVGAAFALCFLCVRLFTNNSALPTPRSVPEPIEETRCNFAIEFKENNPLEVHCGNLLPNNDELEVTLGEYHFKRISCAETPHTEYKYRAIFAKNERFEAFSSTRITITEKNLWPKENRILHENISLLNQEIKSLKKGNTVYKSIRGGRAVFFNQ